MFWNTFNALIAYRQFNITLCSQYTKNIFKTHKIMNAVIIIDCQTNANNS